MSDLEFKEWPKIPRFQNDKICVTEKIDGTNACIAIGTNGEFMCQSRNKIITPEDDNYGFARWAYARKDELLKLGHGYHYGEWYGSGIQRGYGLSEKRFALFNVARPIESLPEGVTKVPVLYNGEMDLETLQAIEHSLKESGSRAAEGFMNPEGFCIYWIQSKRYQKWIINK